MGWRVVGGWVVVWSSARLPSTGARHSARPQVCCPTPPPSGRSLEPPGSPPEGNPPAHHRRVTPEPYPPPTSPAPGLCQLMPWGVPTRRTLTKYRVGRCGWEVGGGTQHPPEPVDGFHAGSPTWFSLTGRGGRLHPAPGRRRGEAGHPRLGVRLTQDSGRSVQGVLESTPRPGQPAGTPPHRDG